MKKVFLALLVVALVSVSGAAFAAPGHQAGNIDYTPVTVVPPAALAPVAAIVVATPLTPGAAPALNTTFYSAIGSVMGGSAPVSVAVLPILSGLAGRVITGVPQSTLLPSLVPNATVTSINVNTIVLILVHYTSVTGGSGTSQAAAAGDEATRFTYVERTNVGPGEFTFVDDTGALVSALDGVGNANLVFNVEDQSDYDLDRAVGSVRTSPVLARETAGGGSGGGGGCDAGLLGMAALFAVAGGYILLGKRGA
jgi:hypothetical protein